MQSISIGKLATMVALGEDEEVAPWYLKGTESGYRMYRGHVGAMDSAKIFAAIETVAKKEKLINPLYREEHALYHCILDAYTAICRGQEGLGAILRTVGLSYSIVRGPRLPKERQDGEWIAVVLFGSIGAPTKGFEHEVIGMGINPV